MEHQISAKSRKMLKKKMASVFYEDIRMLSPDLQNILLDDLVTALETRLNILSKKHHNTQFMATITESVEYETIET